MNTELALAAKDAEIERLTLLYRDVVAKLLNAPSQTDDIVEELDAKDAEIAALKAELTTVTTWGRRAIVWLETVCATNSQSKDKLIGDAPAPVRKVDTDAN